MSKRVILGGLIVAWVAGCGAPPPSPAPSPPAPARERIESAGAPAARHECAFVESNGRLYLIGGRGDKPVDVYDPHANVWTQGNLPPVELHHFQPVAFDGKIYVLGAMTGKYPHETPLPNVLIYDPKLDRWSEGPEIPADRRRGAAGVALYEDKIYLLAGIQDGHWDGHVAWFDQFDPVSGEWLVLPDAPRPRDHFQAGVINGKLYAAAGRRSSAKTQETFNLTIPEVDVYDFATATWSTLSANLPTERAGTSTVVAGGRLLVIGGESAAQELAHAEVESYDPAGAVWESLPKLLEGRHGAGAGVLSGAIYTTAGSAGRGGGPELATLERLSLP
jgi:hypothetical protein